MTTPAPRQGDVLSPEAIPLTAAERARLVEADSQRRLQLLRPTVIGLLVVTLLALPFGIQADVGSGACTSTLQDGIGLIAFAVAAWAAWTRRVEIASLAFFAGVTGVIIFLILQDGPIQGALDLISIPEFALLILPIAIAGIFGGPRPTVVVTSATVAFTLGIIVLTPHAAQLRATMERPNGLVVFTVPLATQIVFGILMVAATRGFHRTQRELVNVRVAYERERELDRLKDQFIASVNHELRTPIMALQGYLELARELGARGESTQQEQLLRRGVEAAEHLATLVRGVLDVRRIESDAARVHPTPFDLRETIMSAIQLLDPRQAGGKPRDLHVRVPEHLAAFADEERVRQVVLNLLSNASKYSPSGSAIEVAARIQDAPTPARRGRQNATPQTPMIEVAVRDYGDGVPPDQAPLLFQRFVRLERDIASPVGGTGLGLAICRAYVEAMGGRIWVDSTGLPGEGSTFIFTLPLAQSASPDGSTEDEASAIRSRGVPEL